MIAGILEQVRVHTQILVQRTIQAGPFAETPVPLPGENGVAGRRAGRRRNVGLVKQHAFRCEPVESGGLHHRVPVSARMRPAPVVGDTEQDVGAGILGSRHREGQKQQRGEKEPFHAGSISQPPLQRNAKNPGDSVLKRLDLPAKRNLTCLHRKNPSREVCKDRSRPRPLDSLQKRNTEPASDHRPGP